MGKQEELAALVYTLRAEGIDIGFCIAVDEGVFFNSRERAESFAQGYDKDLVRVDGQVSGWLAKNRPTKKNDA